MKDYNIDKCCFCAKHAVQRSKSKDWLAWNRNDLLEWGDITICRLFLAHLAKGNVSFCHHLASVNLSHFNLLL
jgi:hypothetical protein